MRDVLNQTKNGKCVARYIDEEELDESDVKKPLRRSAVKVSCPGSNYDKGLTHGCVYHKCNAPIEYGAADQYIHLL